MWRSPPRRTRWRAGEWSCRSWRTAATTPWSPSWRIASSSTSLRAGRSCHGWLWLLSTVTCCCSVSLSSGVARKVYIALVTLARWCCCYCWWRWCMRWWIWAVLNPVLFHEIPESQFLLRFSAYAHNIKTTLQCTSFPTAGTNYTLPAEYKKCTFPAESKTFTFQAESKKCTFPAEYRFTFSAEYKKGTFPAESKKCTFPAEYKIFTFSA